MPLSKGRKKKDAPYVPEQAKGERKVARIGSPAWLAPTMVACFVIGLFYIVIFYIAGSQIPFMVALGEITGISYALVNVAIGFAFIIVGFFLSTKWQ